MGVLTFLAARREFFAVLLMALAVLAAPTRSFAEASHAHSEITLGADSDGASAGDAAHDDTHDRSCHPDPSCSPAAILMTKPIFGTHGFRVGRQPHAETTIRGRNAPVDLPPPRRWAISRPDTPKYPQI